MEQSKIFVHNIDSSYDNYEDQMDVKVEEFPIDLKNMKEESPTKTLSPSMDLVKSLKYDNEVKFQLMNCSGDFFLTSDTSGKTFHCHKVKCNCKTANGSNIKPKLTEHKDDSAGDNYEAQMDVKVEEIPIEFNINKENNTTNTLFSSTDILQTIKYDINSSWNSCDSSNEDNIEGNIGEKKRKQENSQFPGNSFKISRKKFHCHKLNCNYMTENESDFKKHIQIHTNDNGKQCIECGMYFGEVDNLAKHMKKCTGKRQYQCSKCDMHFVDENDRLQHENAHIHSKEKPYQCSDCGNLLTYKTNLYKHIRNKCKAKPYQCYQCEKRYFNKDDLVKHHVTHIMEGKHKSIQWSKP